MPIGYFTYIGTKGLQEPGKREQEFPALIHAMVVECPIPSNQYLEISGDIRGRTPIIVVYIFSK